MYGINYGQVIRGRMSGATHAALGRAKAVSSSVAGAPKRASAATRSGLGRAKAVYSSVAKAPGRVSRSIAKNPKRKIAAVGGGAAFGSYLVGGRRGRGVDKTTDRPTGMYDN